jgi:enediyne biosynthesis protein E4
MASGIMNVMRVSVFLLALFATLPAPGQTPAIHFRNVNREVGIPMPGPEISERKYIIQQMTGGVALLDCDNDGKLDIAVVNESTIDHFRKSGGDLMLTLYHQEAGFKFTDITQAAGLTNRGWGMGIAVADYDNDGLLDIYVTGYGGNVLYHNLGGCKFEDITGKTGLSVGGFSTGAGWADYDRDGRVDLFVSRYIHTDVATLGAISTNYKGLPVEAPWGMHGETDFLYHNLGNGKFEEISKKAGVSDEAGRLGLGVVWGDYDNDGWPDLYVANDTEPNYLYHNKHDGTFEDVALISGAAVSGEGKAMGSMGVDFADFDRDGRLDITVADFAYQPIELHRNTGPDEFTDVTWTAKTGRPTFRWVKWGTGFEDFDNDGWLDLLVASGHIYTSIDTLPGEPAYKEPFVLFRNAGRATFDDVSGASGLNDEPLQSRRGVAFGDLNNDGNIDAVVFNQGQPPSILLNDTKSSNHRVLFKLLGTASNRAAIGARMTVYAGGIARMSEVRSGGSYISQNDLRQHFGLGAETKLTRVVIRWPNGKEEELKDVSADAIYTVTEGSGITQTVALPAVLAK